MKTAFTLPPRQSNIGNHTTGSERALLQYAIVIGAMVGAALVATSAGIHLHLWSTGYRIIPTIGVLFLLQGICGLGIAVAVVVVRRPIVQLAASGFLVSTIGGFLITASVGLFGFHDSFSAPLASVSLVVEGVGAIVLLATMGAMIRAGWRFPTALSDRLPIRWRPAPATIDTRGRQDGLPRG